MNKRKIAMILVGLVLLALGFLWFLQGSDVVHIEPVLCATECKPVTGHSPLWQVLGALLSLAAVLIIAFNMRSKR